MIKELNALVEAAAEHQRRCRAYEVAQDASQRAQRARCEASTRLGTARAAFEKALYTECLDIATRFPHTVEEVAAAAEKARGS